MNNEIKNQENNKIIIYTTDDGQVEIEVRLEDDNKYMKTHLTQAEKDYLEIMGEDIKKFKK